MATATGDENENLYRYQDTMHKYISRKLHSDTNIVNKQDYFCIIKYTSKNRNYQQPKWMQNKTRATDKPPSVPTDADSLT